MSKIKTLAALMKKRQEANQPPYVLFLGVGASLGLPTFSEVVDYVLRRYATEPLENVSATQKIDSFYALLDRASEEERYKIIRTYLSRAAPSAGFKHLAELVRRGYFTTLITTNFDTFLEDSLYDAGLRSGDLIVLSAGYDPVLTRKERPRVTIIKLHGDLYSLSSLTLAEHTDFSPHMHHLLRDYLAQDLIVVGYHARDSVVNRYLDGGEGTLWYVNPVEPDEGSPMCAILDSRQANLITGRQGDFEKFFGELADRLLYRPETISVTQRILAEDGSVISDVSQQVFVTSGSAVIANVPPSGLSVEDETPDERSEEIQSLLRRRMTLFSDLDQLEKKAAMYGMGNIPLYLRNRIRSMQAEIQELAAEIDRLTQEAE